MVFALKFRRDHELLNAVLAERVTELRVAELGRSDPLLLFFHPATAFQREPHGPFQVVVRHRIIGRGMNQLEQPANGLADRVLVAATKCPAER